MTRPAIDVPASETGVIRVFALDLPDAEARRLTLARRAPEDDCRLAALLGAPGADLLQVDVIAIDDLIDGGLPWYLIEGIGADEAQVSADAAGLSARRGWIVIVLSRAVAGLGLSPAPELSLLATYRTARPEADPQPVESASVLGGLADAPRQVAQGGFALPRGLVLWVLTAVVGAGLLLLLAGGGG